LKIALDTNILAYAEGVNGAARANEAIAILSRLSAGDIIIPIQALAELFNVLVKRGKCSRDEAEGVISRWLDVRATEDTTHARLAQAMALSRLHQLNIFDAVILVTAADAGCRILLSEDLQDGFVWGGCTVCNPFAEPPNPLLKLATKA
jgi:predicted nucleic acid-binding protein